MEYTPGVVLRFKGSSFGPKVQYSIYFPTQDFTLLFFTSPEGVFQLCSVQLLEYILVCSSLLASHGFNLLCFLTITHGVIWLGVFPHSFGGNCLLVYSPSFTYPKCASFNARNQLPFWWLWISHVTQFCSTWLLSPFSLYIGITLLINQFSCSSLKVQVDEVLLKILRLKADVS